MAVQEKILKRVRGLLDKAASTEFPEERTELLAKAQELKDRHDIEEAMLAGIGKGEARKPIVHKIDVGDKTLLDEKYHIMYAIARHCRCRSMDTYGGSGNEVTLVGMPDDIGYAEMLYTITVMQLVSKINPSWSATRGFDANVRLFKEAGIKWVDIAFEANRQGGNPRTGRPGSVTDGTWLKLAYRRECARLGVQPTRQTQRHEAYRATFAESFAYTISDELAKMRESAEKATGTEMSLLPAIVSDSGKIDQEFYRLFPYMDPEEQRKNREKREAARKAAWDAMTPEQQAKHILVEDERRRQFEERQAKRPKTRQRDMYDSAGWANGQAAAREVDFSGGKSTLKTKKGELE